MCKFFFLCTCMVHELFFYQLGDQPIKLNHALSKHKSECEYAGKNYGTALGR